MLRIILIAVLFFHGLIHLLGFIKSVNPESVSQISHHISRQAGIVWLVTAVMFVATAAIVLLNRQWWWILAIPVVIVSQLLIFSAWNDAKFATIANIIILLSAIGGFASWNFYGRYEQDVKDALSLAGESKTEIITGNEVIGLPEVVQKYLRYTGALGKEKLINMKIEFDGEMRSRKMDWFSFESEQYNTFAPHSRLFFMKGKMYGLTVPGYHTYKDGAAAMLVKLFGLIPVADNKGELMNKAETVTVLNDICLMAPASMTDSRITWGDNDSTFADVTFENNGIKVSARLYFNEIGQLVNFTSEDRYDISGDAPARYKFSTPVKDYKDFNGRKIPAYGEAVWHYPDGEFTYGKFRLRNIEYNCNK